MKKITKAIHTPFQRRDVYDALQMPVYNCLAFEFDNASIMADAFCGRIDAPDYSRVLNPTVTHLEDIVRNITRAKEVSAFTSGMAAISAMLFSVAAAGKNIITSRHMFGNTFLLISNTLKRFGVEARFIDLADSEAVRRSIDNNTCCVFLESVTNPQTEVIDIREISKIAKEKDIPVIADTTMIPFTEFDGESIGLDFQVVSSTKYISGGATSLGGLIIDYGHYPELSRLIKKDAVFNLGGYMTPQVAYMQTLGMETLAVRYERQAASALEVAKVLETIPDVKRVYYPGLESHPDHEIFTDIYGDKGSAMIVMELENEEKCLKFINSLKMIHRATNLFDNRSLAIHPASTIFGPLTPQQREEMDIKPNVIRLSIGLEDVDDIIVDLKQAIASANE
ncbi:MAG: PLP-dependent transferase [Bacteroides sp.]|nr:PLP-dependent transferase [Bacteroides sp.]